MDAPVYVWLKAAESRDGPSGRTGDKARHLMLALARYLSGNGSRGCFPSSRTLGERMNLSRSTVSRLLDRLRREGWLRFEERKTKWGRPSFTYFPAIPDSMAHDYAPLIDGNGAALRARLSNRVSYRSETRPRGARRRSLAFAC